MKSLLSVLSVTVLMAPPCALAGIVVQASERARRAKDPRRLGAGPSGGGGGTARRDRFVVDEKAAFARRGGNGVGG